MRKTTQAQKNGAKHYYAEVKFNPKFQEVTRNNSKKAI
jgi:hypothetical protein